MKYWILLIILTFFTSAAFAVEPKECLLEKYRTFTKAKEKWQIESTAVITRHSPHLKQVAQLYRDDQLARIEKNQLAVEILFYSNRELLDIKNTLSRWLSLNNEIELSLAEKSIKYKELFKAVKASRTRIPHPDGDELRGVMRSTIMGLPEFQLLLESFNDEVEQANQLQCNAI